MRVKELMSAHLPVVGGDRRETVVAEDVGLEGDALEVALTPDCGALAVRISGRTGGLTLFFDRTEPPALIRRVVREAVDRYKAGLGVPPSGAAKRSSRRKTRRRR
jgi:hypothetical protein